MGSSKPRASPSLVAVSPATGSVLSLERALTLAGKSSHARLRLRSEALSRCHAAIVQDEGAVFARDLSRHGNVLVNGKPARELALRDGDELAIGPFVFKVQGAAEDREELLPKAGLDAARGQRAIEGRTLLLGRGDPADLLIEEDEVSRAHALIFLAGGQHHIRDLYSRTGTRVNEMPIKQLALIDGDTIQIGSQTIRYRRPAPEPIVASNDRGILSGPVALLPEMEAPVAGLVEIVAVDGPQCNQTPMELPRLRTIDLDERPLSAAGTVEQTPWEPQPAPEGETPREPIDPPAGSGVVIGLQSGEFIGHTVSIDASGTYELAGPPPARPGNGQQPGPAPTRQEKISEPAASPPIPEVSASPGGTSPDADRSTIDPISTDSIMRLLPSVFGIGSFESALTSVNVEPGDVPPAEQPAPNRTTGASPEGSRFARAVSSMRRKKGRRPGTDR